MTSKAIIFAHLGAVSAIAFPGEAMNYNGQAVHTVEAADAESRAATISELAPNGVGSPWPPAKSAAAVIAKVTGLSVETAQEVVAQVSEAQKAKAPKATK